MKACGTEVTIFIFKLFSDWGNEAKTKTWRRCWSKSFFFDSWTVEHGVLWRNGFNSFVHPSQKNGVKIRSKKMTKNRKDLWKLVDLFSRLCKVMNEVKSCLKSDDFMRSLMTKQRKNSPPQKKKTLFLVTEDFSNHLRNCFFFRLYDHYETKPSQVKSQKNLWKSTSFNSLTGRWS